MKTMTHKITYRYLIDEQKIMVGLLDDEHPIDWWERNKDYITVLEYEPVFVGEPQPTLSFVPYLVGQLERKARQH
jgi:hypothetical protein